MFFCMSVCLPTVKLFRLKDFPENRATNKRGYPQLVPYFSMKTYVVGYSSEASRQGTSNEYPQNTFCRKIRNQLIWFGFYGPFKNISVISSQSFIKGGQKSENTEKKPPDHLYAELGFPTCDPERGSNHSGEKPNGLTLVLLKPDIPCLCKQCSSRSVLLTDLDLHCLSFSIVKLYQQSGLSNLIGWENQKWACHLNLFSMTMIKSQLSNPLGYRGPKLSISVLPAAVWKKTTKKLAHVRYSSLLNLLLTPIHKSHKSRNVIFLT